MILTILWYIIIFCVGGLIGFIASAILTIDSVSERTQEAYNAGYNIGVKVGIEKGKKTTTDNQHRA